LETSNNEHRTLNAEGARAGTHSAFDVQRFQSWFYRQDADSTLKKAK